MPQLRPRRRQADNQNGALTPHRCLACGQHLHLVRRHVSPIRLGPNVTTEFYQCGACDSGCAFNPDTSTWKPLGFGRQAPREFGSDHRATSVGKRAAVQRGVCKETWS